MHEPLRLTYRQIPDEAPKDGLYLTDREIIRRLGFGKTRGYQILHELDVERPGRRRYPQREPMFCRRRFWPAVLQWHMDYHLGQATNSETTVSPSETTIAPSDLPERSPQSPNTNAPNKSRIESLVNIFSGRANGHHAAPDEGRRTGEETTDQLGRSNGH